MATFTLTSGDDESDDTTNPKNTTGQDEVLAGAGKDFIEGGGGNDILHGVGAAEQQR